MTLQGKILLFILALPLIVFLLCLILPLLILTLLLGIFFPALRSSCKSFTMNFPGKNYGNKTSPEQNGKNQSQTCDVECTVLHAETVSAETEDEVKSLK